jgi:hypothetical protein
MRSKITHELKLLPHCSAGLNNPHGTSYMFSLIPVGIMGFFPRKKSAKKYALKKKFFLKYKEIEMGRAS